MKVVTVEEFIKMPAGTIFCPIKDGMFDNNDFEIKTQDGERYCGTMPLVPWIDEFISIKYPGTYDIDYEIYDGCSADLIGLYECIAVLEEKDVRNLISKLYWALNGCKEEENDGSSD